MGGFWKQKYADAKRGAEKGKRTRRGFKWSTYGVCSNNLRDFIFNKRVSAF